MPKERKALFRMKKIKEFLETVSMPRFLIQAAASAIVISVTGMIYSVTGIRTPIVWICAAVLYFAGLLLYGKFLSPLLHGGDDIENATFVGGITLDLLVKMPTPALICNSNDDIIWANPEFISRLGKEKATGVSFKTFSGHSLDIIRNSSDEKGYLIQRSGDNHIYRVRCYTSTSKNRKYHLTVWEDATELLNTQKTLADEETQVALIVADNIDELAQYAKESTRAAANEIEEILKAWAAENNGILREYQGNRYIFIFRAAEMASFESNKFDILDRIHEVRVGQSSLSVTISIGVSKVSGSLSEKERIASEALDMALQRGGDQVVVKNPKGLEFYGGKTQSVQKRTKVRSRVVANELSSIISQSSRVLIMGHKSPDFDCIGACIGIARLCIFCGVPFSIISDKTHPNFVRCYDRISSLAEYSDDVFVSEAEAQELVGSDVLTVIVDVNSKSILEAPSIAEYSSKTVYIDHHRKTAEFDETPLISYIEPSASSACELVSEILEQAMPSGMLSDEEANLMYAGILLDTNQFTRNTGVRTFSAALYLRDEGASPSDAQTMFKADLSELISEARFESNVVIYRKQIAIACNNSKENKISEKISAAKAADKLLTVEGVTASFVLCRIGDEIHISARSTGKINVALILKKFGGGGHFDSAGAAPSGSIRKIFEDLRKYIDEYFDETQSGNKNDI